MLCQWPRFADLKFLWVESRVDRARYPEIVLSDDQRGEVEYERIKQYALFKSFEEKLDSRATPGVPDSLADKSRAKAYFGAIRLVVGDEAFSTLSNEAVERLVEQSLVIDTVVRDAVAENSLNPQNIEAAIRKGLLPLLFGSLGLDNAKQVVEQVIQITRLGLSKC